MRLIPLLLGLLLALPAAANERPRTEGLFMCPCKNCQGKWLPNCGNKGCSPAQEIRRKLFELEKGGMTDDQVRTAVVQVYGPQIVATPLARETWWAYALPFACLLVGGALVLWLGRGWIARHREAAEEGKAIDTKNPQPDTIEQERIEAAMRELE